MYNLIGILNLRVNVCMTFYRCHPLIKSTTPDDNIFVSPIVSGTIIFPLILL